MTNTIDVSISMGLDAIFSSSRNSEATLDYSDNQDRKILDVNINLIDPSPYQARKTFSENELHELATSIQSLGILQPLTVRHVNNRYELIAGERRLRASKLAGLSKVPVICCDVSDEASMAFNLIENIQRENLNAIDEAYAYKRLLDDFGLTHEKISERVGKSRSSISNSLRLLNLPPAVQELLIDKQIDMGHAKAILAAPIDQQVSIAKMVIHNHYTVRQTEMYVRKMSYVGFSVKNPVFPQHICRQWEDKLYELLGIYAKVNFKENQSGSISIIFDSEKHFKDIMDEIEFRVKSSVDN